jgi:probable phosphoglycerate mutase
MAIYLIRHGETASNAARVLQFPETPLSENGLEQARRLGQRLRDHAFEQILVSDYARAHQTAEAVAATTGAPLQVDPLLRERNFGDLRGRPYAELADEGIEPFADDYDPPGGESWDVFHARVDGAWDWVRAAAERASRDIAVVTHGLVCSSLVTRKVELGADFEPFATGWTNTSVTVLESGEPWNVTLLNCAKHLDEIRETGPA